MSDLAIALNKAKVLVEDRKDTDGIVMSVLMLRTLVEAVETANKGDVLRQLMQARSQSEHILASIRALYENARAEPVPLVVGDEDD